MTRDEKLAYVRKWETWRYNKYNMQRFYSLPEDWLDAATDEDLDKYVLSWRLYETLGKLREAE